MFLWETRKGIVLAHIKRKEDSKVSLGLVLLCCGLMTGCATKGKQSNPDPLEPLNRGIYTLNKAADKMFINPVAMVYKSTMPPPVRASVTNVFHNVGEIPTMANDILQGNPKAFGVSFSRLLINSTLGLVGIFDIASEFGLKRHTEDFGQTLRKWGYKDSIYLVLPILGPSTVRDTIGLFGNYFVSPPKYFKPKERNSYYGVLLLSTKANLLEHQKILESAGVDEYSLVKASYLQMREYDSVGSTLSTDGTGNTSNNATSDMLGDPPE